MQDKSIILLGDIAFNGLISEQPEKNTERFSLVAPFLQEADLVFANLEVPVKVADVKNEYKNFIHYSQPEPTEQLLKLLNIGCVSLANNHIYDCKMDGLQATINLLDELGIYHTGAGWKQEHIEPVIIEKEDQRIGFLAYVDKSTNSKTESFSELLINYFEVDKVLSDVTKLKREVDKIICSIHWGVDYSYYPTSEQVSIAHRLVDNGVDIIMGHHPHTLQPFENYNNGIIFYSMGGLTFGDFIRKGKRFALYRKTKRGIIAKLNLSNSHLSFQSTKELQGNFITLNSRDHIKWSKRKWKVFKIKQSNGLIEFLIDFQEKFIHRVYEYFFGYYQNPFKRLLQVSNIKKIGKLFK